MKKKTIRVQETVTIERLWEFEVPINFPESEFCEIVKKCNGEIYDVEEEITDCELISSDYRYETEEHLKGSDILVLDWKEDIIKVL